MAFDVKQWMKNELGFTDTELTDEFVSRFTPERAEKIEKGVLRQADYSRRMNELQTKNDALTQEIADWTEVQTTTAAQAEERRVALETLETEKLKLHQAVTRLAEQAGLKVDDVLKGVEPPKPAAATAPAAFDPGPLHNQIGQATSWLINYSTELPVLMAEHKALTGEDLDPRKLRDELIARAQANDRTGANGAKKSTDARTVWEEMYTIGEKRTAKNAADRAAEITAAEQRGREAARSEAAIPGATAPGSHAPVFTGQRKSALERPQPGRNTSGFAQSLASGKYRRPAAGSGAR